MTLLLRQPLLTLTSAAVLRLRTLQRAGRESAGDRSRRATMTQTLPQVVTDYLQTPAGQIILEDAVWFRWNLETRRVEVSSNQLTQPPEYLSSPGTLVFVREGKGWRRYA